jgi:antitoxin component YwqK of YwqJK toxin-antitoxin module
MKRIDSLHHFDGYAFVAHVKILSSRVDDLYKDNFGMEAEVTISVLELFKGNPVNTIIEFGKQSSCDVGISAGEEWILFGRKFGNMISVGACDHNHRYRDSQGSKLSLLGYSNEMLFRLKKIFGHPDSRVKNGKRIDTLHDGRIELEENLLNGKLNGPRKSWFPNGQLRMNELYVNDSLDGKSEKFSTTGQLLEERFFKMGKHFNMTRIFYDTADKFQALFNNAGNQNKQSTGAQKVQIRIEIIYDELGRLIHHRRYEKNGILESETISDPDRNFKTMIYYHKNGRIHEISHKLNEKDFGMYRSFDAEGNLKKSWSYDREGAKIQ